MGKCVEIGFDYGSYLKKTTHLGCDNIYPHIWLSIKILIQSNNHNKSTDYDNYPQKLTGYPQYNRINMCKRETP